MSTPNYPTHVHPDRAAPRGMLARRHVAALLPLAAFALVLAACGGQAEGDVDQLVHDGPVAAPRPPRPIALERASGEAVYFSPVDGELSARFPDVDGEVVDVATDAGTSWLLVEDDSGRRVVGVEAGAVAWTRPIADAVALAPLGRGAVAVFSESDWWGLDVDGGARWHASAQPVVQLWSATHGLMVVTGSGGERSLWTLTPGAARLLETHDAPESLLAPSGPDILALTLSDGRLVVRALDRDGPALSLAMPAGQLVDALPVAPQTVALLMNDPPMLAVLTLGPAPSLASARLSGSLARGRSLARQGARPFAATSAGVWAFDLVPDPAGVLGSDGEPGIAADPLAPTSLSLVFHEPGLVAPLAGPNPSREVGNPLP